MKQKLLLALLALFTLGGSNLYAQTTWTGDITNADGLSFTQQYVGLSDGDVAETWKGNIGTDEGFDLNQSLTNVPDGVYELSAQAMYRASLTYGTTTNCVLYATVGETTFSTPIANFGDYTSKEDRTATGGIATQMQNNNAYLNIVPAVIVEGGTVTIGMKSIGELTYCTNGYWFVFKKSTFTFKNVTTGYHAKLVARANTMLATAPDSEAKTALSNAVTTNADANLANVKALQAAINTFLATATSENPLNVTDYITNPSFSDDSGNKKNWIQDLGYKQPSDIYQPTGWNMLYSSAKVNNTQYQTYKTQTDGAKDNNCYYVRQRWGDVYAVVDLHQLVKELPSGAYRLTVAVKGGSSVTDANSLGMKAGNNSNTTSVGDFDKSNYKDYSVQVNKADADTDIDISFGWNQQTGGEQLYYVDDFRLYYLGDPLKAAQSNWQEVHDALAALDATALPRAAKEAITTELENSVPTTSVDDVNSAIAALQALIDSYDGIKAAFDEYKALKAKVEDLKNASKYNFTGDEALSTFNSTLTEIDGNAENATDAETLTALLPNLRTAGNTFVGGIESNDGFDLTYNIDNNSFETGALSPWTTNGSNDTGVKPNSNGTYTTKGVDGAYLFNTWNNGAGSKVSQTLSDLPRGYYTVTALVASDADNKITIMAGSSNKEVTTSNKGTFVEGITDKTLVSDGSLEIGANSSTWYKADNFRLTFYTETAGARDAWLAAKAAAEAALANTDYANVTGSEKTELQAEINKAEPSSAVAYGTATTALQEKTSAFIAAKDSYDAFVAAQAIETPELKYARNDKKIALNDAKTATATSATDANTKTAAIIKALRAYYESNAAAEGVNGAEDLTSKLTNAKNQSNTNGWTVNNTTGNCNLRTMSNEPYTYADGTTATGYLDTNSWGSAFESSVTQNVELYAGKYILSVKARGAETTIYQLTANGVTADITAAGNTGGVFDRGWNGYTVEFELEETGSVALGVNFAGEKWLSFGDFQLVQLELYTEMATAEDYESLNAAITEAEANTLGFDADEYAPYNNVAALQALAAAKAIDPEAEDGNTKEVVQNATAALTAATWTANTEEVDAIFDGQFATTAANTTSGDINLPGWTKVQGIRLLVKDVTVDPGLAYTDGKAAVFSWGGTTLTYGEQEGYTLPMNKNSLYELTLKVSGWRDGDMPNVVSVDFDGVTQSVEPAVQAINISEGNPFAELKFYVTPTADNSTLKIYANKHFTIADLSMKLANAIRLTDEAEVVPETTTNEVTVLYDRKLLSGWNSLVLPFEVTQEELGIDNTQEGERVLAYTGTKKDGDNYTLNFEELNGNLAANTPYLIKKAANGQNMQFTGKIIKPVEKLEVTDATNNAYTFAGTYVAITKDENKIKVGDLTVGASQLNKVKTAKAMKAFRAFFRCELSEEEAQNAKITVNIDGQETDAITAVEIFKTMTEGIYNLQGQKVNKAQKGVYIVNGKKVVIK